MEFLGISFWEFLLILVVIVVVVGPAKIPGIMRTIGTIVRNIRKTTTELTASITREIELDNLKKAADLKPPPGEVKDAAPAEPSHLPPKTPRNTTPGQPRPTTSAPPPAASPNSLPASRSTHDEQ